MENDIIPVMYVGGGGIFLIMHPDGLFPLG